MRILAFDPGHTTGVAFIMNGAVKLVSSIDSEFITHRYICELRDQFEPDLIVIETAPYHVLTDVLTQNLISSINTFAEKTGCSVCRVPPGLWKPVSPKPDKTWAIHGADAVGLALYMERIRKA